MTYIGIGNPLPITYEYERKEGNFKSYDGIVNQNIRDVKNLYYFNTFTKTNLGN